MNTDYPVSIYLVDDASEKYWVAEYIDLPGCIGVGSTQEEALEDAKGNMEVWLEAAMAIGREIPNPSSAFADEYSGKFNLRIAKSLHRQLVIRSTQEGVSLNALCSTLLASGLKSSFFIVRMEECETISINAPKSPNKETNASWASSKVHRLSMYA